MRFYVKKDIAKRLKGAGRSYKEIADLMNVSRDVARNLCRPVTLIRNKPGPKGKITKYNKLSIKREVCRLRQLCQKVNSTKIINNCKLSVSQSTTRRFLVKQLNLKYKIIRQKLSLNNDQRIKRMDVIKTWIHKNHHWTETVFTDEKVFSLDGPDDYKTYTMKNESLSKKRRVCGGGKVMVWLMALPNGLLAHRIYRGMFNSEKYIDLLSNRMLSVMGLNLRTFVLQADNSRIHTAKKVKAFLEKHQIQSMIWPPYSPDLNIVEDIWSLISADVYDNVQFRSCDELERQITSTINNFNCFRRHEVEKLFSTMTGRLIHTIEKSGAIWNKKKPNL